MVLDEFFDLEEKVHRFFGYTENWKKIPIVDGREYYWMLEQNTDGSGKVTFHEENLTAESIASGQCYSHGIYTQRFLPKWVYRAEDFTMICEDTHTDGNQWFTIYDNTKEVKVTEELKAASALWNLF